MYYGIYVAAFQRVTPYIMWAVLFSSSHFTAFFLSFVGRVRKIEKSDLDSPRVSPWNNSAPTGRIFVKLIFKYFSKICRENSSLINA